MEIKNDSIIISTFELLEKTSGKAKLDLIDALSCDGDIIKNVADQIVDGCTDMGSHGYKGSNETPHTPLDIAIRRIADNSSEIAKKEIRKLESLVKEKDETINRYWEKIHKLGGSF